MRRAHHQYTIGLVLLVQACTWVGGVERTDLSPIGTGASRVQAEELLGQPILEKNTGFGPTAVYRYQHADASGCDHHPGCAYILFMPYLWPFLEHNTQKEAAKGKRFLTVVYDDNGLICQAYRGFDEPDTALGLLEDANEGDEAAETTLGVRALVYAGEVPRQCGADLPSIPDDLPHWAMNPTLAHLMKQANRGAPHAQYTLAYRLNDLSRSWKWYCLAAQQGHPEAGYAMGNYYRHGHTPVQKDLLRAYVWYRIAEANGYEGGVDRSVKTETGWKCCEFKRYSEIVADQMMPSELEKGGRLVSNWQPNPAACQSGIDHSTDSE